ncbi:MAG: sigma-54 dependent transcriptional regulator [Desulfobacterales bacterium]|nr:sigma-54 dependent transcriptional regulator [Desulfobacterales bacterium]
MADILIIDDEESVCRIFSRAVSQMGHRAEKTMSLGDGLQRLKEKAFDLVLLDVRLPDGNGLEAVDEIIASAGNPEVIIITGQGDPDGAELATRSGAWAYVEKPPAMDQLSLHIARALQYRDQKARARQPVVMKRGGIVGSSPAVTACLEQGALAAAADVNVLITGETGTGKELFARAIHDNSRRASQGFVPVDCAALPETLAESVLFGHVKGAFTGADKDQRGLVREADGGTLFLDEVGEMSPELQKSFLRTLQEKRVRPVGSVKEVGCDFRLIAATNRDLESMAGGSRFRSDLLYRIRTVSIELPPLRKRLEDIRELSVYFIKQFCLRENIEVKSVSPDFFDMLAAYPWPGNVRELMGAVEGALSAARYEPVLYSRHIPENIRVHQARTVVGEGRRVGDDAADTANRLPPLQDVREKALAEAEKRYLQDLMRAAKGNISKACKIADLSRSRLYTLLKKYDIR